MEDIEVFKYNIKWWFNKSKNKIKYNELKQL
jgi:hypothetical protein